MINNIAPWSEEVPAEANRPSLTKDLEVDVAIIGGGITGITSAYLLAKAGKRVAVLEKDRIGSGETAHTTAFLSYDLDTPLAELKATFKEKIAFKAWVSAGQTINRIEAIIKEEKIDCDFSRCPLYRYALNQEGYNFLRREYNLARRLGFLLKLEYQQFGLPYHHYLKFGLSAKFQPLKYLSALTKRAEKYGALIFENTPVLTFRGNNPITIKTSNGFVKAQDLIFAIHQPIKKTFGINNRLVPAQTFVLAAQIPSGILPEALYHDTLDPYHYFRIDKKSGFDRIILGGEDRIENQPTSDEDRFRKLENYLKQLLPKANYTITHRWSGQIFNPIDGLPLIGNMVGSKHRLIATGFAGDGLIFGTLSSFINTDIILGQKNPLIKIYEPRRFKKPFKFLGQIIKNMKKSIIDLIKGQGEDSFVKKIKPDSGEVFESRGKKIAIYKDSQGKVIKLSPICSHKGCIVNWNNQDKTWDCPCHGSRYDKEGKVIQGPAPRPLSPIE